MALASAATSRACQNSACGTRGSLLVRSRAFHSASQPRLPDDDESLSRRRQRREVTFVSHGVVPDRAARAARGGLDPLARALHSAGIGANAVTAVGVILT